MSFEWNLPNFQVDTPGERRLYTYLYQTVQQLNWAMKHIETAESTGYLPVQRVSNTGVREEKTPIETFSELKSLIIKSADIVNAYCDTIRTRLEGVYVGKSEFGEYAQRTNLELEVNAQGITQNYNNLQGLHDRVSVVQADMGGVRKDVSGVTQMVADVQGDMDSLRQGMGTLHTILLETSAYIKTGAIDTDGTGVPIYGLEIGQTNEVGGEAVFNKYARFSSSRLSFYDQNDTEVAYISDYKLYITNVHITGKLTIGYYAIEASDGLAFLWVGGENT